MKTMPKNLKFAFMLTLSVLAGFIISGCGSKAEEPNTTQSESGKASNVRAERAAPAKSARPAMDTSK